MKKLVYLLPALFFFSVACDRNELEEITPFQTANTETNQQDFTEFVDHEDQALTQPVEVEFKKEMYTATDNKPYHSFNSVQEEEMAADPGEDTPITVQTPEEASTNNTKPAHTN